MHSAAVPFPEPRTSVTGSPGLPRTGALPKMDFRLLRSFPLLEHDGEWVDRPSSHTHTHRETQTHTHTSVRVWAGGHWSPQAPSRLELLVCLACAQGTDVISIQLEHLILIYHHGSLYCLDMLTVQLVKKAVSGLAHRTFAQTNDNQCLLYVEIGHV